MNNPPLPAMIATHTAQAIRRTGATLATQPAGQINAQQPSGHQRVAVVIPPDRLADSTTPSRYAPRLSTPLYRRPAVCVQPYLVDSVVVIQ
jgi:hypothetical protein